MRLYNKHTIQSEETLKSIAILYNCSEEELIMFHNNRSKESDKIFIGIRNQKELFLPRHVVLDKSKLVNFKTAKRLAFEPVNSFYKYGVNVTIENGDKKNEINF